MKPIRTQCQFSVSFLTFFPRCTKARAKPYEPVEPVTMPSRLRTTLAFLALLGLTRALSLSTSLAFRCLILLAVGDVSLPTAFERNRAACPVGVVICIALSGSTYHSNCGARGEWNYAQL
jgi:hypothetical protein